MNENQNTPNNKYQSRYEYKAALAQQRHERRIEAKAERAARRLEHAQRPRRDWTFEFKAGDKVYTFSWRWFKTSEAEGQEQAAAVETSSAPSDTAE